MSILLGVCCSSLFEIGLEYALVIVMGGCSEIPCADCVNVVWQSYIVPPPFSSSSLSPEILMQINLNFCENLSSIDSPFKKI